MNFFSLAKRINRPLILDGAMGSMLQNLKVKSKGSLWMSYANFESPQLVYDIHKKYIEAGADIITTNTFRTNPAAMKDFPKIKVDNFVRKSVSIAIEARDNLPVLIAGSNAPAEDCYQAKRNLSKKSITYNHHKHIELLMNAGCDFILNETQSHIDEILIICKYCRKKNIPFVISFFFNDELKLLSGEKLSDALELVYWYGPLAVGINCVKPTAFKKAFKKINKNMNWGFYLNCGIGRYTDNNIQCGVSPKDYLSLVKKSLSKYPSFIGSCCGSSPSHIKEIKKYLDERN